MGLPARGRRSASWAGWQQVIRPGGCSVKLPATCTVRASLRLDCRLSLQDDASAGPSGSVASGTAGSGAASAAPSGSAPSWCGHMDEEDERRLWLSRLELAALQALDLQAALRQEVGRGGG